MASQTPGQAPPAPPLTELQVRLRRRRAFTTIAGALMCLLVALVWLASSTAVASRPWTGSDVIALPMLVGLGGTTITVMVLLVAALSIRRSTLLRTRGYDLRRATTLTYAARLFVAATMLASAAVTVSVCPPAGRSAVLVFVVVWQGAVLHLSDAMHRAARRIYTLPVVSGVRRLGRAITLAAVALFAFGGIAGTDCDPAVPGQAGQQNHLGFSISAASTP